MVPGCNPKRCSSTLDERNLTEISALGLDELHGFVGGLPAADREGLARVSNGLVEYLPVLTAAPAGPRLPGAALG